MMFKEMKVIVPQALEYPLNHDDDGYHPIDERNHYTEVLQKIFGEQRGAEMGVVDIKFKGEFLILSVIEY